MLNYRAGRYLWQLPGQECKCHLDITIKLGLWECCSVIMSSVKKKKKSQSPSRAFKKHCELVFFPPLTIYVNGSYCHKILMIVTAEGKKNTC